MNLRLVIPALICLLPVACGAEDSLESEANAGAESAAPDPAAPGDEAVVAEQTVLHTVETGGETIQISKFTTPEGQEAIMMREEGSAYQQPLLDALLEEHGPLTTLETIYALEPDAETPHQAILDVHAKEAAALGRTDLAVQRVQFDVDAAVEKSFSTTACSNAAYPNPGANYTWTLKGSRNSVDGFTFTCLNNNCSVMTSDYTISRICNDADTTVQERNAWDLDATNPWNTTAWTNVPVGTSVGWYMVAGASRRYSADGNSAAGKRYHARSGAKTPR